MSVIRVCPVAELKEGEVRQASAEPPVAVYNIGGEVYATSNICSHDHFFLSDGYVDDDRIECSLHFAQFCIRTGEAMTAPATAPIATYAVEIRDGDIYVSIPET
ncbi:bifunctional 3-phenylpropionate/cinnamic acid dioxygenase ferredoxin subunit [Saccharomonospora sp. NPDC046836]|uniref:bifunctional 3-phenylpropionate/cinnamic acid dioxygenase ferredoxin subunit n=1 Tax=Saccharomonospora sp. NPDC046836 TaxID=3156921 RepID=UPI003401814A